MAKEIVAEIFARLRERLAPVLAELPMIIGNAGVNYALDAFEQQGLEGAPWLPHKDKKATNALLVKSGVGRRSIRVIRTSESSVVWGSDVGYMQMQNDGAVINRPARSETFVRPRYERGAKSKLFGGKGAFRKMTAKDRAAAPTEGQSYKAYSINIPARPFLRDTPALRQYLKGIAKERMQEALTGL